MNYLTKLLCIFMLAASLPAAATDLALVGAKVYPSPTAQPINDAVVLVQDGTIAAVGKRSQVHIPPSAQVINCLGEGHRRRVLE